MVALVVLSPWWCRINMMKATFLIVFIGYFILVDGGAERHSSNTFHSYTTLSYTECQVLF